MAFLAQRNTDRPIRIRFEYTRYPHWGGRSGYTQFVQLLDSNKYHTTIHGASDNDDDLPGWLKPAKPLLHRLVARGHMPWYKLSDLNAEALTLSGCFSRRFDIVHFLDGEHSGLFLPRLVRLAHLSVRTIATFHQPPEVACKLLNRDILRWFDQVILVSPSQLPFFREYVHHARLHVILHGVDAEFFRPSKARKNTSQIRCVTVGHWLRDWQAFTAVARAMEDVTFEVVTNQRRELRQFANVRVHHSLSDSDLAELYRAADLLFLPLIQSTANNALLEGMASGLPVITTDLESTRVYLSDGVGILVPENRVTGFVAALRRLQHDPELRQELGRRSRKRAEELAWFQVLPQYESVYAEALSCSPKKGRIIETTKTGVLGNRTYF